jgi:hypothetical protein
MPNINFTSLFWNVFFTLIFIYMIRVFALRFDVPVLKDVVLYQIPAK